MLPHRGVVASLVVEVVLTGNDPAGGSSVSSPLFRFPVNACSGCLVDFSTGNDPLLPQQPNCLKFASATLKRPCTLGQDEKASCELCVGRAPACDPKNP